MAEIDLTPGVLPPPACYPTEQDRFDAYVAAIIASISGGIEWEASQTAPTDLTLYWLRLDSNNRPIEALKWSTTDGAWVRWSSEAITTGASGGVANAYTLTNTPAMTSPTAMRPGQLYGMFVAATNTTAVTLNIDGVGAFPIRLPDDATALVAGDLVTGQGIIVMVNQAGNAFLLMSPTSNVAAHGSMLLNSSGAGNFTVPGGVFSVTVQCVGGGGGGDFTDNADTAGGGGGGYCSKIWTVTPGQIIPYVVGAGGVRTSPDGSATNTDGGNTTFNATQIAYGGGKGSSGGLGGSSTGSDYGLNGSDGTRLNTDTSKWQGGVAAFQGSLGGAETTSPSASTPGLIGGGGCGDKDKTDNAASGGGDGLILINW